ncbi:MAG: non-canonical purine NTP diphosphatase [Bacteroidales bacterium]|nr:non-canonical purine NTP diphosphatase [Bacteroidales bacterium]
MELIFATNNLHKLSEISAILKDKFSIKSLKDIGFFGDIPETNPTIPENASQKSHFIHDRYKINCFADDTGLEIEALNGEPGVYSARYAGENATYEDNMYKALKEMDRKTNRKARFITVISLIIDQKEYFFEGIVNGTITTEPQGSDGFGYDPIFMPEGYDITYAQMSAELKNSISHRGLATQKLVEFLTKY